MTVPEIIYSTAANKCPRCHEGKIFEHNNPYKFNKAFKMRETCSECGLKYEREPGFFYGAMYVSYALMVAVLVAWLLADFLWLHTGPLLLLAYVAGTMFALFPAVFRWARIIWLNFFFRYDKTYSMNHSHKHSFK